MEDEPVFQSVMLHEPAELLRMPSNHRTMQLTDVAFELKENGDQDGYVVLTKKPLSNQEANDDGGGRSKKAVKIGKENSEASLHQQLATLEKLIKNHDKDALKNLCRAGHWSIDHPIRRRLWCQLTQFYRRSRSEHLLDPEYRDYSNVDIDLVARLPRKLPGFVDTGFCRHFQLNRLGQMQLDRILWQVASDHPEMTYCPLLYPITALFLHYLNADQTYAAISNIVEAQFKSKSGRSQCLLPQTRTQIIKDAYVLIKLTSNFGIFKQRQFYEVQRSRLTKYYELDSCFLDWLKWIFIGLPFQHLVRILDCYLVEGTKLLFRVGIAILILYKRHLTRKRSPESKESLHFGYRLLRRFSQAQPDPGLDLHLSKVLSFCEQLNESPAELMELAFGISRFSSSRIDTEYNNAEQSMKSNRTLANLSSSVNVADLRLAPGRRAELVDPNSVKISNRIAPKSLPDSTILNWQLLDILWEWLPDRLMVCEPQVLFSMTRDGNSLNTFYTKAGTSEPTLLVVKTYDNEIFGAFCSSAWSNRLGVNEVGCKNKYFGTGESFLFKLQPTLAYYPWIGAADSVKSMSNINKIEKATSQASLGADSLLSSSYGSVDLHPSGGGTGGGVSSGGVPITEQNGSPFLPSVNRPLPVNCQLFMCGERHYICVGSGGGNALWLDENLTRGRSERCLTFDNEPLSEKIDFICINCELIGFR